MVFKFYNKKQLKFGVYLFAVMALLFLIVAISGESLGTQMESNGQVIQKSDPDYPHEVLLWRIGVGCGSLFAAVVAWFCHWRSRRMSDEDVA